MRGSSVAVAVLLTAVGAYALGWWVRGGADEGVSTRGPERDPAPATPAARGRVPAGPADAATTAPVAAGVAPEALAVSPVGAPRAVGPASVEPAAVVTRPLAEERAKREALLRGDPMEFLKKVGKDSVLDLVATPAEFARLFERKEIGSRVEGVSLRDDTLLATGDRIAFPRGQFRLDPRAWKKLPFPSDIVIEGDGMDETLVVLASEFDMAGDVRSLTLRDLTLHCNEHNLTRMRSGAHTLRLENCRVIGFDAGAGRSVMLDARDCAFFATRCAFEGGFGNGPGSGTLFNESGTLLVRLENCDVIGPFRNVWESSGTYVFDHSRFTEMDQRMQSTFDGLAQDPAVWAHSTVVYATREGRPERRSVAELNRLWTDPKR